MEVDSQLHGLASLSPKEDAPSARRLRGGMSPKAGLCTQRTGGLSFLSGIEPRFLDCPSLSLFTAPTSLFRQHLIIGAFEAYFACRRHKFFYTIVEQANLTVPTDK